MEITSLQWGITIALILGLLAYDFVFHVRKAHEPTIREAAIWSAVYVGIALFFGLVILWLDGPTLMAEYYGGYITEKALSVDNLFVFLIIMGSFAVPRADQQKVLLFGIVFALVARTVFIFVGAAAINAFSWVFYLFGLILILTAGNLIKGEIGEGKEDDANNIVVRLARKVFHTTDYYDGDKLFTVHHGKRALTPMLLVMVAIGGTDILFALDSIPAIFGLTQEPYIVFTATAFSLMGLRQLYFLIDGLLDRLIYLSWGLSLILAFIGVKLVLHALHENTLPFINDGAHVPVVEIGIGASLAVIISVLVVTVLVSLYSPKGRALRTIQRTQDLTERYLALPADAPAEERNALAQQIAEAHAHFPRISEKHKDELIESRARFRTMLETARGQHREFAETGRVSTPSPDLRTEG
ncbi:TerC family protein [Glutamicibacter protophormiae]|uniref:Putative membrane protein n=1 Tax=Kocuria varians TaxID=1272 RepID=A0A7D7L0X9_KOCVA|nr:MULTISPECIES: TerC family protein [Kocuria]WNB89638.1 TerC family protein [Glutamicibacter protophormiae]MDN5631374.1 TerC family protein [Kocuria sp.]QMS57207.1 putative membrane protein [Kocuria varians]RUP84897.1 TerC family protein [Kocuria sp. HSID17590]RUQ08852.1 TerC family protein [Kocuria sp. HSID17582]